LHVQIGREKIDGNDYGEVKCTRMPWRVEKVNGCDAAREIRVPFAKFARSHFGVYFTEHELFPKYVTPSATYLRCEVI